MTFPPRAVLSLLAGCCPTGVAAAAPTIDRITLSHANGGSTYSAKTPLYLPASTHGGRYYMSDGTSWDNGAGGLGEFTAGLSSVDASDPSAIRYTLDRPVGSQIYYRIDYGDSPHISYGILASTRPLVLTATPGSSTATISGYALVTLNELPRADQDPAMFHYFTAPVGKYVPFTFTYTIRSAYDPASQTWNPTTWSPTSFDNAFLYSVSGTIDLAHYVPEPSSAAMIAAAVPFAMRRRKR